MNLPRFSFLITVLSRLWKCMEGLHWENIKANYEAQTYENDCIVGPGTSTHLRSWVLSTSQNIRKIILPLYISPSYQQKNSPKEKKNSMLFVLL